MDSDVMRLLMGLLIYDKKTKILHTKPFRYKTQLMFIIHALSNLKFQLNFNFQMVLENNCLVFYGLFNQKNGNLRLV